jgi:hypothetical protein
MSVTLYFGYFSISGCLSFRNKIAFRKYNEERAGSGG